MVNVFTRLTPSQTVQSFINFFNLDLALKLSIGTNMNGAPLFLLLKEYACKDHQRSLTGVPRALTVIRDSTMTYYLKTIDWKTFYAVSAIFQPCNGGPINKQAVINYVYTITLIKRKNFNNHYLRFKKQLLVICLFVNDIPLLNDNLCQVRLKVGLYFWI